MKKTLAGAGLGAAAWLWAPAVWACGPHEAYAEDPSMWSLLGPVMLLLGLPAVMFSVMVPSPLSLKQRAKLWPIQLGGALLGLVMLVTLAFKERRAWTDKVEETIRRKVSLEALHQSWRAFAHELPDTYRAVMGLASAAALGATMFMWGWTVASPEVTWGQGWVMPVTFVADTVLTFVGVRWMMRRVGFHLASGLMDVHGGISRFIHVLFRGTLMGSAAGWFMGALFGLSSGVQTMAMLDASPRVVPVIMLFYGFSALMMGAVTAAIMGMCVLAVHKPPRGLLAAPVR